MLALWPACSDAVSKACNNEGLPKCASTIAETVAHCVLLSNCQLAVVVLSAPGVVAAAKALVVAPVAKGLTPAGQDRLLVEGVAEFYGKPLCCACGAEAASLAFRGGAGAVHVSSLAEALRRHAAGFDPALPDSRAAAVFCPPLEVRADPCELEEGEHALQAAVVAVRSAGSRGSDAAPVSIVPFRALYADIKHFRDLVVHHCTVMARALEDELCGVQTGGKRRASESSQPTMTKFFKVLPDKGRKDGTPRKPLPIAEAQQRDSDAKRRACCFATSASGRKPGECHCPTEGTPMRAKTIPEGLFACQHRPCWECVCIVAAANVAAAAELGHSGVHYLVCPSPECRERPGIAAVASILAAVSTLGGPRPQHLGVLIKLFTATTQRDAGSPRERCSEGACTPLQRDSHARTVAYAIAASGWCCAARACSVAEPFFKAYAAVRATPSALTGISLTSSSVVCHQPCIFPHSEQLHGRPRKDLCTRTWAAAEAPGEPFDATLPSQAVLDDMLQQTDTSSHRDYRVSAGASMQAWVSCLMLHVQGLEAIIENGLGDAEVSAKLRRLSAELAVSCARNAFTSTLLEQRGATTQATLRERNEQHAHTRKIEKQKAELEKRVKALERREERLRKKEADFERRQRDKDQSIAQRLSVAKDIESLARQHGEAIKRDASAKAAKHAEEMTHEAREMLQNALDAQRAAEKAKADADRALAKLQRVQSRRRPRAPSACSNAGSEHTAAHRGGASRTGSSARRPRSAGTPTATLPRNMITPIPMFDEDSEGEGEGDGAEAPAQAPVQAVAGYASDTTPSAFVQNMFSDILGDLSGSTRGWLVEACEMPTPSPDGVCRLRTPEPEPD